MNKDYILFVFSRSLNEIDMALRRMAGHYALDGSTDNLFQITRAVTSNYYYCPSLEELSNLRNTPILENVVEPIEEDNDFDLRVVFEYCTNCGYFTIYQKARDIIMKAYPKTKIIENPKNPRLACFEIYTEDGFMLFSKLAQPNGMNNYPECFPTDAGLQKAMREYLGLEEKEYTDEEKRPIVWGLTDWEEMQGEHQEE